MAKITKQDKAQALETLSRCYPKGATVYTIVRSVSRSGMQAQISVLCQETGGWFIHPNWACSVLTGYALNRGGWRDAVKVNGCGFDRAESVKEGIERALGYKAGDLNHVSL